MARVAARVSSKVVTTPAANSKTMVSSPNMGRRGMSATVPAMATAMSAMTAAMSSTGIHWWRDYQKSCHHKRSKR
jgi:hypothetical protein